ncbi:MAG: hypothetical protein ABI304_03510 [Rudaea sp.]
MNRQIAGTIIALAAAALLQACNQAPDMAKVESNVAKARAEGQQQVIDAQAALRRLNDRINQHALDTQVSTRANDANKESVSAQVARHARKMRHEATREMAYARYDVDNAKATASNNVAQAQCEAKIGAAEKSCRQNADALFNAAIATAKMHISAAQPRSPSDG